MPILVTYATAKGSTREIAERIASRLGAFVTPVDCLAVQEVRAASLANYSAVIVGSAIHMGSWLSPARHFIHSNQAVLKAKPVWVFSVGMPPQEEDFRNEERRMDGKIRNVLPDLRGHRLFQGRFYKQDLNWFLQIIFTCCVPRKKVKWGDHRAWEKVEAWADNVGKEITSIGTESTV
ncbi:Flavodoxin domain-containing protein [Lipomyces starkeyi]